MDSITSIMPLNGIVSENFDNEEEINFDFFSIKELLAKIKQFSNKYFGFESFIIDEEIKPFQSVLKDDLFIISESNYIDKVYRDNYCNYYSTKHYKYKRNCIRLHFFSDIVSWDNFFTDDISKIQDLYLGFVIIRPLRQLIGRTILNPNAFKDSLFLSCSVKVKVSVLGKKLYISGFPYSSQNTENMTCAETTLWSVMEYFGNKYPEFTHALPSKIKSLLTNGNRLIERMEPSTGLGFHDISYLLTKFGLGVKNYSCAITPSNGKSTCNDLMVFLNHYIDSGLPVITIAENPNSGEAHSFIVIGRKVVSHKDLISKGISSFIKEEYNFELYDVASFPDIRYVCIDDNCPPYSLSSFSTPLPYRVEKVIKDSIGDKNHFQITSIIVPLNQNIYLEVVQARETALSILKELSSEYSFTYSGKFFRLYLSSSRTFKDNVTRSKLIDNSLKKEILKNLMPKFIWITEIGNIPPSSKGNPQTTDLLVIDATADSFQNAKSLIFFLRDNSLYSYNKKKNCFEEQNVRFTNMELFYSHKYENIY